MKFSKKLLIRTVSGLVIGLFASLIIIVVSCFNLYEQFELKMLDLRFNLRGSQPVSKDIIHIDMDDTSVEKLGRWPWPRDIHAKFIDILSECGAWAVVFDVLFIEPSQLIFDEASGRVIDHDQLLAEAIRDSGRVYLPCYLPAHAAEYSPELLRILKEDIEISLGQAAEKLDKEPNAIKDELVGARKYLIMNSTKEIVQENPRINYDRLIDQLKLVFKKPAFNLTTQSLIKEAFDKFTLIQLFKTKFGFAYDEDTMEGFNKSTELVPPLLQFTTSIAGSGIVNAEPDIDGVMRKAPVFWRYEDKIFPQLAVKVGCDFLGVGEEDISISDAKYIRIKDPERKIDIKIPIDREGRMLVNWSGRWLEAFKHIPYYTVIDLWRIRQRLEENLTLLDQKYMGGQKAYLQERLEALVAQQQTEPSVEKEEEIKSLRLNIQQKEAEVVSFLEKIIISAGDKHKHDERFAELKEDYTEVKESANRERELKERLTGLVKGKICIVGLTATATHDIKPIPLQPDYPMVGLQSNILNTILQGKFLNRANRATNLVIFIFTGLLIGIIIPHIKAWKGIVFIFAYLVFYFLICLLLFIKGGLWIDVMGSFAIGILSFTSITTYRYMTEEKEKRWVKNAFQHYLSEKVVSEILEDPSVLKLGGQRRRLTVLFSDIRGFTSFSEGHNPEDVVSMLNEYLDEMTEIIFEYNGTLDKFVGDEIMVIYGAPGFTQEKDHALMAVKTAVAMMLRLRQLQEKWKAEGKPPLEIGIGINTGEMVVGNMGSSKRMDYTVIGDNVNLAARLVSVAKGGQILISEATFLEVEKIVEANKLPPIFVKGKKEPIPIYEVKGLKENPTQAL